MRFRERFLPQLKKFDGFLIRPDNARRVVTPAYDGMSPMQRREFAGRNPGNYVNVMRTLEEYDDDCKPTLDEILQHNQSHLDQLLGDGVFVKTKSPAFYLYRLRCGVREQTGVIADMPVSDYVDGRLKKHEDTQLEKENMLTQYHEAVGAMSSPICVAYPDRGGIDDAVERAKLADPYLSFAAWDEVEQTVWRVDNPQIDQALIEEFADIETTYLTDGHHRCASSARFSTMVSGRSASGGESPNSGHLLVALFPQSQLRIYSYFRCVRDLNGLDVDELIEAIADAGFKIEAKDINEHDSLLPDAGGKITMIVDDKAYALAIPDALIPVDDPTGALDVSILQNELLAPILNIQDARADDRLSYMPGTEGISGLIERCKTLWRVGFACVDTKIEEVIQVADAKQTMPPKSTWFDPKLRAGIFLRTCR